MLFTLLMNSPINISSFTSIPSISLSEFTRYHQDNPNPECKNVLCYSMLYDILDNHIDDQLLYPINGHGLRMVSLDDDIDKKACVLETIECFKFAIENGYTYDYDAYRAGLSRSNEPHDRYKNLNTIVRLCCVDSQEVRDFVVYYFRLLPDFHTDEYAITYIIIAAIITYSKNDKVAHAAFKNLILLMKQSGIYLHYIYYNVIDYMQESNDYDMTNTDYIQFLQIGLDFGIKINDDMLDAINNLGRRVVRNTHDDGSVTIVPMIIMELHALKFVEESAVRQEILAFLTNLSVIFTKTYEVITNYIIQIYDSDLNDKLLQYYRGSLSFTDMLDILIDHIIENADKGNGLIHQYSGFITQCNINTIEVSMQNKSSDPELCKYISYCVAKLSYIEPFHLSMEFDSNIYNYKRLNNDRIKNYAEWYNTERTEIEHSNKIKLRSIIRQKVSIYGYNQEYTNLLALIDIIAAYC